MTMQTLGAGDPHRIGPYVLTGRLGAGGMGSVYLGWDPSGRPAAVKVVRTDFLQDPDFRARFRREISSARRVSGPWISRVLDADPDAESPWLATEYVAGPTLDAAVNRFGPLPTETVAVLAQCLGQAMQAVPAAIFLVVKIVNAMSKKAEEAPAAPQEPTQTEKLLTEIRDALKK